MSEEDKDVALSLMEMREGRTSGSTHDDTLSGVADGASSAGATSEAGNFGEDEMPAARRQKLDISGSHRQVHNTTDAPFITPSTEGSVEGAEGSDDARNRTMAAPSSKPKTNGATGSKARSQKPKATKAAKPKTKKAAVPAGPMTPSSLPGSSRTGSLFTNGTLALADEDEEQPDLSTQPRCKRCRRSKKGCDRQRPCGRCVDAGLGLSGCESEEEENGRKGRYGRHMGVPIKKGDAKKGDAKKGDTKKGDAKKGDAKKSDMPPPAATHLLPAPTIAPDSGATIAPTAPAAVADKNKKRKR
jgi:hypothetical protein